MMEISLVKALKKQSTYQAKPLKEFKALSYELKKNKKPNSSF